MKTFSLHSDIMKDYNSYIHSHRYYAQEFADDLHDKKKGETKENPNQGNLF